MKDELKTKQQLIMELAEMRRQVDELVAAEADHQQTKSAVREARERYRDIHELAPEGILTIDLKGFVTSCNTAFTKLTGYSTAEIVGKHVLKLPMLPKDKLSMFQKVFNSLLKGKMLKNWEFKWQRKNGNMRWGATNSALLKRGRKPYDVIIVLNDITKRKRTEEALRVSQNMLLTVLHSIPSSVFWKDRNSIYLGGNRTWLEAAGLKTSEEVVGKSDYDLPWEKEQADSFREVDRKIMESGIPEYGIIEPYVRADGLHAWALTNKVPLQDTKGNVIGILGTYEDITERMQAEKDANYQFELQQVLARISSEFINMPVEEIDDAINLALEKIARLSGTQRSSVFILTGNRNITNTHEWCADPKDSQKDQLQNISFDTFGYYAKLLKQHKNVIIGKPADLPLEATAERDWIKEAGFRPLLFIPMINKTILYGTIGLYGKIDEERIWNESLLSSLTFMSNIIINALERKTAEKQLKQSENRFRHAVEDAPFPMMIHAEDGEVIKINNVWTEITGYALEDIPTISDWTEKAYGQKMELVKEDIDTAFKLDARKKWGEYVVKTSRGEYRIWDFSTAPLGVLPDGHRLTLSMARDTTDRKKAEERLRESEEKFRSYVDSAPDGIFVTDENGKYIDVNEGACRMTGYSREELLSISIPDFVTPELLEETMMDFANLRKGKNVKGEYPFIKKDGSIKYWALDAVKLSNNRYLAFCKDITERKQWETEIRDSREQLRNLAYHIQDAREEERTVIAREIHDELGQALTAMKMDLAWMSKHFPKDDTELFEKSRSLDELIDVTIAEVQRISSELRPGMLDDLGLIPAMEWQIEEYAKRSNINFISDLDSIKHELDQSSSTVLFRIFQEAVINAVRHSGGTQITISIKDSELEIKLTIEDNGKGILMNEIDDKASLGLTGMKERALSIGGKLTIKGTSGKGTKIVMSVPLHYKSAEV